MKELPPSFDQAQLTETGLVLPEGLSYDDWIEYGRNLKRMEQSVMWCIGDWWNYSQWGHGKDIAKETGLAYETCAAAGKVANKIEFGRRLPNLSWSHHQAVAFREPQEQAMFLSKWEIEQPSVAAARAEVSLYKRKAKEQERAQGAPKGAFIVVADCLTWLPEQPDFGCDLLLTDPPYSTDVADIETFVNSWLPLALDKVAATGRAYICIGAYPAELRAYLNADIPAHLTLENVLVWTYRNTLGPSPKYDYKLNWQAVLYYRGADAAPLHCPEMVEQFSVQDINAPDGRLGDRWHAWQKPDSLAERFIRHSTQPDELVYDPFAGTGTFLLAAARLGRLAYGCEADPEHAKIALDRGCRYA